jgi:hypothetical protein
MNDNADDCKLPNFPDFDSLPAGAGLDNVQAFRLSIRHALTLLPTVLTPDGHLPIQPRNPERFRLL